MTRIPPVLNFYSYDSTDNPWLGGGGAYRDFEVLSRQRAHCSAVRLFVGAYPGARRRQLRGVEIIPLGFGKNEIVSRITYVIFANLRILQPGRCLLGISSSIYSPLPTAAFHRSHLYAVLHHVIGRNWMKKLGAPGRIVCALEDRMVRMPRYLLVSNSELAQSISLRHRNAHVFLTANGFDPDLLSLPREPEARPPYVLFVGRLDPNMKGLDLLVNAFATLADRYPDLHLVLAGRGDPASERALQALAEQGGVARRVRLQTNISEAEKRKLLSGCLFFCSPSRFEGWGIAALEANAAGKPVVVSNASGFRDSIRHNESGIRVDLDAGESLSQVMSELLDHPERRAEMGLRARAWARQFSWDDIAEKEWRWLCAQGLAPGAAATASDDAGPE